MILMVSFFSGYIPFDFSDDNYSTPHITTPSASYLPPAYIQYIVSSDIIIDDTGYTFTSSTWQQAAWYYPWMSGEGTKINPYKIRYVLFHGDHLFTPLTIRNSNAYFVIQYCIFMNSSRSFPDQWSGLALYNVQNGAISQVIFENTLFGISGSGNRNINITDTIFRRNGYGTYFSGSDCFITNNSASLNNYGFQISGTNNTFTGNRAFQNNIGYSIYLDGPNSFHSNEAFENNGLGFKFSSNQFEVNNNLAYDNGGDGMLLFHSNNLNVHNNQIYDNGEDGIIIDSGENNTFSENYIVSNKRNGIFSIFSGNNLISFNHIESNELNGIYLDNRWKENTTISRNIFKNNLIAGVNIYDGQYNTIYNNSFLGIYQHAINNDYYNSWDYNGLGNYWNNYSGEDLNDDGIGDTPYPITGFANAYDYFPQWSDGEDIQCSIYAPLRNKLFAHNAPMFNISFSGPNVSSTWYKFEGRDQQFFFSNNSGTINQTVWNSFGNGLITLKFYFNNSENKLYNKEVAVQKDIVGPVIEISYPNQNQSWGIIPSNSTIVFKFIINDPHFSSVWLLYNDQKCDEGYYFTTSTQSSSYEVSGGFYSKFWNNITAGEINITIYTEDSMGNIGTAQLIMFKEKPKSPDPPQPLQSNSSSAPNIAGYSLVFLIGIIIAVTVLFKRSKQKEITIFDD